MDKPKEKRVVSIAPFDKDGRLLMGKRRDTNKWCFPGGKLEGNEKPEKGAIRELVEESGTKPSELTYLGEGMAGKSGNVRVYSYRVKVTGEPTSKYDPDNEFSTFKWFDPEDGLPKEIEDNLYNLKDITLRLLGLQNDELIKGSFQSRHPFNPTQIDPAEAYHIKNWQTYSDNESRQLIPRLEGNGRIRALTKLHSKTKVRRGINGEREFLLHRAKDNNYDSLNPITSYTWNYEQARAFEGSNAIGGKTYPNRTLASEWIPESRVHHLLEQNGRSAYGQKGKDDVREGEVLVSNPIVKSEDLNKAVIDPTKNPNFNKWFEGSKAVDHAGNPKTVYHGTTHKFHIFTNKKGNPENYYGTAHYFTDSPEDVSHNYAGQGPDLTRRIENEAERISQSDGGMGPNDSNISYDEALKIARRNLIGKTKGHVIPAYLHMKNPIVVEPKGGTRFSIDQEQDENGDFIGEPTGNGIDLLNAINEISNNYDLDGSEIEGKLHDTTPFWDSPTAHEIEQVIRNYEPMMDRYDDNGASITSEFIKNMWRKLGYDGVIMDAYAAFGPKKLMGYGPSIGGMPHVSPGTKHYVVFEPNQIKSIFNKNFNPRAKNFGKAEYDSWSDIVRPQIENESYSFPQRDPTHNPEFNKWFKDSKAVHWEKDPTHKPRYSNDIQYRPTTKPLTAFHGTKKDFSIFNSNRQNSPDKYSAMSNWAGELGSWFTAPSSKHPGNYDEGNAEGIAEGFTDNRSGVPDVGARVTPVHLSIKNPAEFYDHEDMMDEARPHKSWKKFRTHLESKGHDGIVIRNSMTDGDADRDDWIAFHPHQIKSAVGNNGQFNVNDPDITKSEFDDLIKMAIKDIPIGTKIDNRFPDPSDKKKLNTQYFNYDHVLPKIHQSNGYRLQVSYGNRTNPNSLGAHLFYKGNHVGAVFGPVLPQGLHIDHSNIDQPHRGKGFGMHMYEALLAHAYHNLGVKNVTGDIHSSMASTVHRKLAEEHDLDYNPKKNTISNGALEDRGPFDNKYGPYKYTIKSEDQESPDQITRMQQHPSAIERRMALKLAGVNAHHISTGLHDPDKEVRTAALKHPLFDSKHIDEVFDTHDNDMISEALHSPHVRIDHLDRAWPFEPLKDIVINHPKLTADHINRFMEDADNSRKIELLNHPNIDSSVINNVYTQNIDKANHGETNYLFLNSLANPQLSQEHLNEALHSPIPQIQLNAARNPNISQAEIEKLLLDDHTSRELRNLLITKHKE